MANMRRARGGSEIGRESGEDRMQFPQPNFKEHYDRHYAKALEMMSRTIYLETSSCHMPELHSFFSGADWELPDMAKDREELNKAKNVLDDWDRRRWERAASDANPADQVRAMLRSGFHVELGTIAWAKMYETLWQCDMMPRDSRAVPCRERGTPGVVSVHLCEAPGAFIAATNHFVKTHRRNWRWDWMAVSLNPYCEANDKFAMIEDDALIAATMPNWCFGADNTGDIRRIPNIQAIWERAKQLCTRMGCPGGVLMVTADGAVDTSMDPNRQELITASLHYCEVVAALGLLAVGGNFVWKGFTLYEHPSICSLYLMGCLFDQVLVYKPATSKPANSEVYVVGKGFRGVPSEVLELLLENCGEDIFNGRSLFPLEILPRDFLATACHAATYFGNATAEAIREAVDLEGLPAPVKRDALRRAKEAFAEHWCGLLRVQPLDRSAFLAPDSELDGRRNNTSGKRKGNELTGTLEDRKEQYNKRVAVIGGGWVAAGGPQQQQQRGGVGEGGNLAPMSKAAAMMAKMGHVTGQGLGRNNQGIASALDVEGNRRRAGLGLGQGSGGAAVADWSLAPDTAVLPSPGPLTEAELEAWPALARSVAPPPAMIKKSKMVPDDAVLMALREARQECAKAAAVCHHVRHCVAPRRLHHASRAYWKLAAVDSALEVCRTASHAAARSDSLPRALDLSLLSGAGATEYLIASSAAAADGGGGEPSDWRVTMLDTDRARQFAVASPFGGLTAGNDPRVHLQPLPPPTAATPEPGPLELCTAASAASLAKAVPGCWLVVGDLGSLRRLEDPRAGLLEGELSPAYRRALLWEVATALGCLAPGGCLVLRLGSCLTMFSAGVLYLLYRSFAQVSVVKPFACCACSSERLVVCTSCLDDVAQARKRVMEALQEVEMVEVPLTEEDAEAASLRQLPAALLTDLVPPGAMMRDTAFLRYMERRMTALVERETQHCRTVTEAAAAGEPPPSEEELEALAQTAQSVLEGAAPPAPSGAEDATADGGGDDDDIQKKYGGMFTRGGLGSSAGSTFPGVGGTQRPGARPHHEAERRYHPPPPPHQHQRQQNQHWPAPHVRQYSQMPGGNGALDEGGGGGLGFRGGDRGGGSQSVTLMFRLLSRSAKGEDEVVCRVRCELSADAAARTRLDRADSAVATRYCYRKDFEPQHHFQTSQPLRPEAHADAVRLGRLMAFLANTRQPDDREKIALLTPQPVSGGDNMADGGGGRRRTACLSLQRRDDLDPERDGLVLWC